MAKVTPNTITGGHGAVNDLNTNFSLVAAEFDNCLSLDGTTPNSMSADIDMNNQDLLNANVVSATSVQVGGQSLVPSSVVAIDTASSVPNVPAGNIAASDVQSAINELDTEKVGIAGTETITGNKTFSGDTTFTGSILLTSNLHVASYDLITPTANAFSVTTGESLSSYTDGYVYSFVAGNNNTGAATLNIDGVGAKAIKLNDKVNGLYDIISGMIYADGVYHFKYNSSTDEFVLLNPRPVFRGISIKKTATQSIPNSTHTLIDYSTGASALYDTDGFFSAANGIVIPRGVEKVRVISTMYYEHNGTGYRTNRIVYNGAFISDGHIEIYQSANLSVSGVGQTIQNISAAFDVSLGDVITNAALQTSGGALNIQAGSMLALEVVQ